MKHAPRMLALAILLVLASPAAADWLHWRGPQQNGFSPEKNLPDTWSPDEKAKDNNLVWRAPFGCRSAPVLLNDRLYFLNAAGEGTTLRERIVCLDANSGKLVWDKSFNVFHCDIVEARVGWTSLAGDAETGNIYAHGTQGFLMSLDKDGKVLWSRSLTEEFGRVTGYGGRIVGPIVDEELVIVGMINASWGAHARGANRFVACNKKDGSIVWWSELPGQMRGTYYSTPVVAVINGQRLLITGGADGAVHALKVRTGQHVWSYTIADGVVNPSPVVDGNLVYITHGEENLDFADRGRIVCLDASQVKDGKPKLVWENKDGIIAGYVSPLLMDGKLFVCDDSARMFCFDAKKGTSLWGRKGFKYGRLARGSPLGADGKIYIAEVNSKFHILKPTAKGCERLQETFFPSSVEGAFVELNSTPIAANGKVYLSTRDEFFCIGKKDHKPEKVSAIEVPKEAKPGKISHLQVLPADVTLFAGESVEFKVRAFDENGQLVKEVKAELTLPAPPPPGEGKPAPPALRGEIAGSKLTVDKGLPGQAGMVQAKAEGLTGAARVRVVPKIPYQQDFEKVPVGAIPGGWTNTQGKFVVAQKGGSNVLKKLANDSRPPLSRANAFFGPPSSTNYIIEADVLGSKVRDNMPDVGICNQRYTLMLDGKQNLRIVSWEAQEGRLDKTIPWKWAPEVWYRMRLDVVTKGDKALIRGKVWPRDQAEPKDWSIEIEDPIPNREGSPALYGYATGILEKEAGAEIFYDNVTVTPK